MNTPIAAVAASPLHVPNRMAGAEQAACPRRLPHFQRGIRRSADGTDAPCAVLCTRCAAGCPTREAGSPIGHVPLLRCAVPTRPLRALVLANLVAAGAYGCGPSGTDSAAPSGRASSDAPVVWQRYPDGAARFHVELPGAPEIETADIEGHAARTVKVRRRDRILVYTELDGGTGGLPFADFVSKAVDTTKEALGRKLGAPCLHDAVREFDVKGLAAADFTIRCGPKGASRKLLVDGGDRVIQLVVTGAEDAIADEVAERFFRSLAVD